MERMSIVSAAHQHAMVAAIESGMRWLGNDAEVIARARAEQESYRKAIRVALAGGALSENGNEVAKRMGPISTLSMNRASRVQFLVNECAWPRTYVNSKRFAPQVVLAFSESWMKVEIRVAHAYHLARLFEVIEGTHGEGSADAAFRARMVIEWCEETMKMADALEAEMERLLQSPQVLLPEEVSDVPAAF
jgi:hypothetical protein